MKWQRARIINAAPDDFLPAGALVWVEAKAPEGSTFALDDNDERVILDTLDYYSNWRRRIHEGSYRGQVAVLCLVADKVELLPEFADDVPLEWVGEEGRA